MAKGRAAKILGWAVVIATAVVMIVAYFSK